MFPENRAAAAKCYNGIFPGPVWPGLGLELAFLFETGAGIWSRRGACSAAAARFPAFRGWTPHRVPVWSLAIKLNVRTCDDAGAGNSDNGSDVSYGSMRGADERRGCAGRTAGSDP